MNILSELVNKDVSNINTNDLSRIQKKFDKLKKINKELEEELEIFKKNNFVQVVSYTSGYTNSTVLGIKTQEDLSNTIREPFERKISILENQLDSNKNRFSNLKCAQKKLREVLRHGVDTAKHKSGIFSNNRNTLNLIENQLKDVFELISD